MQKSTNKLNANTVGGAAHSDPLKEKGITLIALIITIIVMLILVGVTINVALNGGLFEKAETATRETEEKAILEEMLAMMVIEDNGKFNPDTIIANMRNKHPEYQIDDSNKPNITIRGKLGTYKYIVSETEIKIGSKFDWEDVGLIVDTDTDYKFYDTRFSTTYIINFTADGKLIVKANGTTVETYDATDENDGILTIPFTYAGTAYDTTLKMNSNNIDVDAELKDFATVTYIKEVKTDFIAYQQSSTGMYIVEISDTEVVIYYEEYGVVTKANIVPCTNVFDLKADSSYDGFENNTEFEIKYSKALIDDAGEFAKYIYFEDLDNWAYLGTYDDRINNKFLYTVYNENFFDRAILSQEQIDTIMQVANETT